VGEFLMPALGADMEAGTVLEWRVQPGDTVHHGDIVAVVDTEKSDIEVEVFEDGVVEELLVATGREVPVGTPLARIAPLGAAVAEPAAAPAAELATAPKPRTPRTPRKRAKAAPSKSAPSKAAPAKAVPAKTAPATAAPAGAHPKAPGVGRVRSSPLARRRAAQRGLDLGTVSGSGPGGAVLAHDVAEAGAPVAAPGPAVEAPAPAAAADRRSSADRALAMRSAIAELMARSKREIPHYYLATTVDLAAATGWLAGENARRPITERLLPAALLLKATALAARQVPALNGFWDGGFQQAESVHLGVAVSLRGGGLLAPAIHDADRLTLDELMASLRDLVERARAGRLRSSEMSDPTLTVTNLGDQGADEVHGVIYPPQVALVGFGRIVERPWATGGLLGVRPTVRATLAADHRATDGHEGSKLLAAIDRLLQAPEAL
jgi:pyruvate dehydrogenase E2 component (dihydrolipoamide acetyltransferase)